MPNALAPRDPLQCHDGLASIVHRLRNDCLVDVTFAPLPPATTADWWDDERRLVISADAPVQRQLRVANELWMMLITEDTGRPLPGVIAEPKIVIPSQRRHLKAVPGCGKVSPANTPHFEEPTG